MRLTEKDREEIILLAEYRGLNAGQIALRLKASRSAVHLFMATNGLHRPVRRNVDCVRNGVRLKSFSREEDAYIEALRVQGFTCAQIGYWCGRRFGHERSAATIGVRLKMLASACEKASDDSQRDSSHA